MAMEKVVVWLPAEMRGVGVVLRFLNTVSSGPPYICTVQAVAIIARGSEHCAMANSVRMPRAPVVTVPILSKLMPYFISEELPATRKPRMPMVRNMLQMFLNQSQ